MAFIYLTRSYHVTKVRCRLLCVFLSVWDTEPDVFLRIVHDPLRHSSECGGGALCQIAAPTKNGASIVPLDVISQLWISANEIVSGF